jgi:hypothetical protein
VEGLTPSLGVKVLLVARIIVDGSDVGSGPFADLVNGSLSEALPGE